jgi:hypothetical protein
MKRYEVFAVVLVACATPTHERGATGLAERVPVIAAPKAVRCTVNALGCHNATYLAQTFVHRLSPGDAVCLEGGVAEPPTGDCVARAAVVDTAPNRVLLEVRAVKPGSTWADREQGY